jgi:hypothetical protein
MPTVPPWPLSAVRSVATIRNVPRTRIPASVRLALTVILCALPVALYLWLISADAVDMLRADQWYDVNLIQSSLTGRLTFSMLWAQHGDNRIFFQNLLTLLLGRVVHYNVIVEEFINAGLLIGALALLIFTHRRRAPKDPLDCLCARGRRPGRSGSLSCCNDHEPGRTYSVGSRPEWSRPRSISPTGTRRKVAVWPTGSAIRSRL